MSAPLYEITAKHRELALLGEENEDMAQAVADTMEMVEGEFEDKAISLINVMKNLGAGIPSIDAEIARLIARKKTIENNQAHMTKYLQTNMEASGISKIECPLFTITLAKGRDIVQVDDADKIPAEYMNYKTSASPMKKEILAALKEGEKIDGASLVKSSNSIRIK